MGLRNHLGCLLLCSLAPAACADRAGLMDDASTKRQASPAAAPVMDAAMPAHAEQSVLMMDAASTEPNQAHFAAGGDPLLRCPEISPCQNKPLSTPIDTLLRASDLGSDVHFVAISDGVILASNGAGQALLKRTTGTSDDDRAPMALITTKLTAPQAIALDGYDDFWHALLCDEHRCEVHRLGLEGPPTYVTDIAAESGTPAGILTLRQSECSGRRYAFCVFGDGMSCFDGAAWTRELEPPGGQRILAASGACLPQLAAGERGTLWRYDGAAWQAFDTETDVDLTTIAEREGRFSVAGEGVLIEGDPFGWIECGLEGLVPQKLVRVESSNNCLTKLAGGGLDIDDAAAARSFDTELYGISTRGELIHSSGGCSGSERWACDQSAQPVLDFDIVSCGLANNPWLLTQDVLRGAHECPID